MKYVFLLFLTIIGIKANAQSDQRAKAFNIEKGLAVSGFDVVAYFTQNKAMKGDAKFAVSYEGITYRFSSDANKTLFLKNPKNYEPQYGGWCAYAMGATGEKVEIDPETFKILNGKLYLFYHSWTNNTLTKWNKDETHLKTEADKNWTKLYH
jgi:YHS domain-containing protein